MPSIHHRPGRPTFYPDWSTLVYAFNGWLDPDASADDRALAAFVDDVARNGNLCLSITHVFELLRGTNIDERTRRAHRLDELDVVWLLDMSEVLSLELTRYLRNAAGLRADPLWLPAAASFLSTFRHWNPEQTAEVLLKGTVTHFVAAVGHNQRIHDDLEQFVSLGPMHARRAFADRKLAEHNGLSELALRLGLKAKLDQSLLAEALEANRRLVASDMNYCVMKGSLLLPPDDDDVIGAMRPLDDIRNDLPLNFIFREVLHAAGDMVSKKEHTGTNFFTDPDRKSDVLDWSHLVGAAYCDAFTCDKLTAKCLRDARKRLGLPQAVVFASNDKALLIRNLREILG